MQSGAGNGRNSASVRFDLARAAPAAPRIAELLQEHWTPLPAGSQAALANREAAQKPVTRVTVFRVRPENQSELAQLLVRATEELAQRLPGFVSASIHRSLDGASVISYEHWSSPACLEGMQFHPRAAELLRAATALASDEPILSFVIGPGDPD